MDETKTKMKEKGEYSSDAHPNSDESAEEPREKSWEYEEVYHEWCLPDHTAEEGRHNKGDKQQRSTNHIEQH